MRRKQDRIYADEIMEFIEKMNDMLARGFKILQRTNEPIDINSLLRTIVNDVTARPLPTLHTKQKKEKTK